MGGYSSKEVSQPPLTRASTNSSNGNHPSTQRTESAQIPRDRSSVDVLTSADAGKSCKQDIEPPRTKSPDASYSSIQRTGSAQIPRDRSSVDVLTSVDAGKSCKQDIEPPPMKSSYLSIKRTSSAQIPRDRSSVDVLMSVDVAKSCKQDIEPPPTKSPDGSHPSTQSVQIKRDGHIDVNQCQKVFKTCYAKLCDALPTEDVLPQLVSRKVITIDEMDDVLAEKTRLRQARALLNGPIWRAISGGYPEAFITLLHVLRDTRSCKGLCEDICANLNISAKGEWNLSCNESVCSQSTVSMSTYRQQLQYKYELLPLSSPEELLECHSSEYVNLFLTKFDDRSKRNKEKLVSGQWDSILKEHSRLSSHAEGTRLDSQPLTLADVLDVKGEKKKVVLIEGGPGMGKSTLAFKICKCWAKGELLQEYDAVILLPLRDPELQEAKSIKDLLLILDEELNEEVYKEIIKSGGERICFLFEGFDELPDELRKAPVFAKLTEKLPKCTLVYTSRPEACDQLRRDVTRRIEIRGFKEEQVDEYINNAFDKFEDGKEKAVKLISQLKTNPLIRNIMYIPINVAIVCHLFLLNSLVPNTLTQLYILLCLNLILRHITKHNSSKVDYLVSLDDLPMEIAGQFDQLCLIAYRGRQDNKIVFSSLELKGYGIDASDVSGLGLLLIAPSTSVYGREKSYNFLHLTVQEFCAAFHISKLSAKEQCEYFKKYQLTDSFQMIWRFYSGMTGLGKRDILDHMLPSKWVKSRYRRRRTIELLHCVYEAQSVELCHVVGDHLEGSIDLRSCRLDQISCSALGYLLEQYRGALKLVNLSWCVICDDSCEILLSSLLGNSKFELNLCYNDLTDKSCSIIASSLALFTKLNIGLNQLSESIDRIFTSLHHNTVLTELLLGNSSLRSSDMQLVAQMLTSNNTLSVLDISWNEQIGAEGCQYLVECKDITLTKLIMLGCRLGVDGASRIGEVLSNNKFIEHVDLGRNSIGDSGVERLLEHLKSNTIKHLGLWNNNITSSGADHLRKLFTSNHSSVNSIDLSYNPLKDEGLDLILQSISVTMEHVGIHGTGMTSSCSSVSTAIHKIKSIEFTLPDNCDHISNSLTNTTVLEELVLRDGSDVAYHTMISGISRNSSIKRLSLRRGHLDHPTVSYLVQVINLSKTVTELHLFHVDVAPSDCLLLSDVLSVNSVVKRISISCQPYQLLDQSLVLKLLKKLNCTLEVLSLRVTDEADDDNQFIREVEMLVAEHNQSHGVTTPLHVELCY